MNKDKETISAYLDDSLNKEELEAVKPMESESGFGVASRYQMIGEALRGQPSDAAMIDISAQVREALQNEESHQKIQSDRPARQEAKPSSLQPKQSLFDLSAWFRPLGGMAVAASVALVTVVAVTQVDSPEVSNNLIAGADDPAENVPGVVVRPVAVAVEDTQPLNQQAVNLDAYLAEHAEFAAQDTLQGRMPYARAVSYESE